MADASYERQHIATHAAGYINAAGSTALAFGCLLTRIGTGHYGLLLDVSAGLVNDEGFTLVQPKESATDLRSALVQDLSDVEKRVRVFNDLGATVDTDIEVILYKTVTR